jgi:serine phosphatase RsbU (regulator of sigma subunit)
MKAPAIDELVSLPEPLAVQRHFDARNYRLFRWLLGLSLFLFLPAIGTALSNGWFISLVFYVAGLLITMALVGARQTQLYETWFRQVLLVYLFSCVILLKVSSLAANGTDNRLPGFFLAAFAFLVFRLRFTEQLMLYGWIWVAAVLPLDSSGHLSTLAFPDLGEIVGLSTVLGICLVIAFTLTQIERRRFLVVWRREHSRSRERERMREEIDTARRIQLSMLPQGSPDLRWLEVAAASLPATEVGGDYYEYFRLSSNQLALVIGDVAGHGVASGLLLSGVRSCLYLLEKELDDPLAILERLNPMVRRTTDRRTYVTLLCAVLEKDGIGGGSGTVKLASAGHPPVLRWCARTGEFDTMGEGAPPLGTFLDAHYQLVSRPLQTRDILVFYTDGLLEARNAAGLEYGEARFQRAVARLATSGSAREVRDAVLGDLANFKGDEEQYDDITIVVVRMR